MNNVYAFSMLPAPRYSSLFVRKSQTDNVSCHFAPSSRLLTALGLLLKLQIKVILPMDSWFDMGAAPQIKNGLPL